jgi:hypothetical protein
MEENNTYEYRYEQSLKQLCNYYSIDRDQIQVIYAEIELDVVRWKYLVKTDKYNVLTGYTGKFMLPNSTRESYDTTLIKYLHEKGLITIVNIV